VIAVRHNIMARSSLPAALLACLAVWLIGPPARAQDQAVTVTVRAEAPGLEAQSVTLQVPGYQPSGIFLRGVVRDAAGDPLQGATVALPDLGVQVQTDATGAYVLNALTEGTRPFTATQDFTLGAAPAPAQVAARMNVRAEPAEFQRLHDQAQLSATITDAQGNPLPGVRVTFIPPPGTQPPTTVLTDAGGLAAFTAQHVSEQFQAYTYTIRAMEMESRLTVVVQPPPTEEPPPPAPTPQATPAVPLAPHSIVKQAITCEGLDEESKPQGVRDAFPAATEKVGLFLRIVDAPANSELSLRWCIGEKLLRRQIIIVSGTKETLTYIYAANRDTLWEGRYAVEIMEKGQLVGRIIFTVG
jgi:hypothetical protein